MNPVLLTRARALVCVALVWTLIYLPGLGSLEIKGEEGRRLLPAQTMLETGRWIVPSIGGVDYLSKPPLINWLAAAAFRFAGDTRNEWAARAPSVLAVLALGLCTVAALSSWLGPGGALLAAIFTLTNIGLMEKGRLAEIEALYLSLTGIAVVLWLGAWRRDVTARGGRRSWGTWTLPWVFLGLGMLTKGPIHLLFFYAVVSGVLVCAGRRKDWFCWPHLVGVGLMLAIFGAWAVPYLRQTAASGAGGVWLAQFQGRMEVNEKFRLAAWALNVPRGLINYLPWAALLPLAWRSTPTGPVENPDAALDRAVARGLRWAVAGCFLVISLAPGGQPRYTLPLLTPASVLLAFVLARRWRLPAWLPLVWARTVAVCLWVVMLAAPAAVAFSGQEAWCWVLGFLAVGVAVALFRRVRLWRDFDALALASAGVMALLTALYTLGVLPLLCREESVRPQAAEINDALAGERATILRPGFLPFLFYLHRSPVYVQKADVLPASTRYLLVREGEKLEATTALHGWSVPVVVARVRDRRARSDWLLLRFDDLRGGSL
ncbi:MAG: glycosyltransferase family 39 protein [Rhodospirillales bacterium]|nr:glycosyltransferase family 39 protein [Acetobacter sp.]